MWLKRIVTERALDISMLKDLSRATSSLTRRRDAVARLTAKVRVSERRAWRLVGQHRSTNRYAAVPADLESRLVARQVATPAHRHERSTDTHRCDRARPGALASSSPNGPGVVGQQGRLRRDESGQKRP